MGISDINIKTKTKFDLEPTNYKVRIFFRQTRFPNTEFEEIEDLYWFEENYVHDLNDDEYEFKIKIYIE